MQQLVVECSDPGLVIYPAEEFEHTLRHIDFARALALKQQLSDLAQELGPEVQQAWQGFGLEVPNDGGTPPSFGKRDFLGDEPKARGVLRGFLTRAEERGLGAFKVRTTMLLPQDGPSPETREQYVRDLADGIRSAEWEELGLFRFPAELPASMASHRRRLMEEWGGEVLRERARDPGVGHRWVEDSLARLRKALEEINTRSEAVIEYELDRLHPAEVEAVDRIHWAALAVRLGHGIDKWFQAAVEPLAYLYQKAALISLLWTECRGFGPARPLLEERLEAAIQEAEGLYTADAVAALRLLQSELCRPLWGGLPVAGDEQEGEDEGESVDG